MLAYPPCRLGIHRPKPRREAALARVGDIAFVGGVSVLFALVSWNLFAEHFLVLKDRLALRAPEMPERAGAVACE
jgi:hypothetical protein